MAKRSNPYDVKLSDDAKQTLVGRLRDALQFGLSARNRIIDDGGAIDFAYSLYEQQPQRGVSRDTNRYGGADLTSPIGTQMVDTLTAIAGKTVFVEPFWIAEGVGNGADKAAAAEEFNHWRFEEMEGQQTAEAAISESFIEEGAVLEVCEDALEVQCVDVVKAKLLRADDGTVLLDDKGRPQAERDEAGDPVKAEADESGQPLEEFVEVKQQYTDTHRRGASLKLHSMKDFLFLPGHARNKREVWGHAWRFWTALDELKQASEFGTYDADAVAALGTAQERDNRNEQDRTGTDVQVDHGSDKVEKELWRIQMYADLGKGIGFYIVTFSLQHDQILSVRHDWLKRWRTVYVNPYPRTYSVYGYSLILNKLLTTIEGHTAFRNMNADRSLLKSNSPIKRLSGSMWEPTIQPFGAGEIIDVSSMQDVQPFEFEDVSQHSFQREREFYEEAARIVGVSDILASVNPKVSRTLGENEMVTEQSFSRTENPIRNIQEAFEELGEIVYAVEYQALEDMDGGLDAPYDVGQSVRLRSTSQDYDATPDAAFAFTIDMLPEPGRVKFKPRGSVETADPNRRVNNFMNQIKAMVMLKQAFPALAPRYDSPPMADAINQQFVDVMKPRDKAAYLAPLPPPMPPMMPGGMPGAPSIGAEGVPGGMPPVPSFGGGDLVASLASSLPGATVQ